MFKNITILRKFLKDENKMFHVKQKTRTLIALEKKKNAISERMREYWKKLKEASTKIIGLMYHEVGDLIINYQLILI